jgi:hypothetical protein
MQRCSVHKERNLLAHASKQLHDEIKADFNDMVHARTAAEALAKRKAFLTKWKLRCRPVAISLEDLASAYSPSCATRPSSGAQDHECHRVPARGVQTAHQDAVPSALRRDRRHAVLRAARLGSNHHAPGRRLADLRALTHRS